MTGALLTLILCLITASSRVLLKKGLKTSNPLTGMVASLYIGFIALALFAVPRMFKNFSELDPRGIAIFLAIGVVAPPLVRWLTYIGVDRLGASRADPIRSSQPFFALLFSGFFLGESVSWNIWFAAIVIFVGVLLIMRPPKHENEKPHQLSDNIFPIAAAIIAGFIFNARKFGMQFLHDPVIAAFLAATSALIVFSIMMGLSGGYKELEFGKEARKYFLISGVLTAVTDIIDLWVLQISNVKIVAPLLGTTPVFVVLLSFFFLKDQEKVTKITWIGTLLIVVGIQVILYEATL